MPLCYATNHTIKVKQQQEGTQIYMLYCTVKVHSYIQKHVQSAVGVKTFLFHYI